MKRLYTKRQAKRYFSHILDNVFYGRSCTINNVLFVLNKFQKGETLDFSDNVFMNKTSTDDFYKTDIYKYNYKCFDGSVLKQYYTNIIRDEITKVEKHVDELKKQNMSLITLEGEGGDDDAVIRSEKQLQPIYQKDFINYYMINEETTISDIHSILSQDRGNCDFVYDWSNSKLEKSYIMTPENKLQRIQVTILGLIMTYNKGVVYSYHCSRCGGENTFSIREVESDNYKGYCKNVVTDKNGNPKECGKVLSTPNSESVSKTVYVHQAMYRNEYGNIVILRVDSFNPLDNMRYDMVGLSLTEKEMGYFLSLDVKRIPAKRLDFSPIITKNEVPRSPDNKHNFVYDVIKFLDDAIFEQSGERVHGLLDVKLAMLVQKFSNLFKYDNDVHVMLIGYPGVGKTYTFSTYGKFLYPGRFMYSDSKSISIAALRGSSTSNMSISSVSGNKNMLGLLSMYDCIYIDEARENENLLDFMKSFLLQKHYSNNTADGDKVPKPRSAQFCVAENPDTKSTEKYVKSVKEEYERIQNTNSSSSDDTEKVIEPFSYDWDLFQPLSFYENKDLRMALSIVRQKYYDNQLGWIDSRQLSTMERFSICYHLKRDSHSEKTELIIKDYSSTYFRNPNNDENIESRMSDIESFMTENINDMFYMFYHQYSFDMSKDEHKKEWERACDKVFRLSEKYDYLSNTRFTRFCLYYIDIVRILNKRMQFNSIDFDMLERFFILSQRMNYESDMKSFETADSYQISRIYSNMYYNNNVVSQEDEKTFDNSDMFDKATDE